MNKHKNQYRVPKNESKIHSASLIKYRIQKKIKSSKKVLSCKVANFKDIQEKKILLFFFQN